MNLSQRQVVNTSHAQPQTEFQRRLEDIKVQLLVIEEQLNKIARELEVIGRKLHEIGLALEALQAKLSHTSTSSRPRHTSNRSVRIPAQGQPQASTSPNQDRSRGLISVSSNAEKPPQLNPVLSKLPPILHTELKTLMGPFNVENFKKLNPDDTLFVLLDDKKEYYITFPTKKLGWYKCIRSTGDLACFVYIDKKHRVYIDLKR